MQTTEPGRALRWLASWLSCAVIGAPAHADEVLVAVAANFVGPMQRIAAGFQEASGHRLKLSSGASGRFVSQVRAGAPFEVLIAADQATPRQLVQSGHAIAGTQFTYAIGQLALWSATPGLVDGQGRVLETGRFRHLAIANPRTAPYGAAAMDVLKSRGLAESLAPRLVTGESVAQAHQFVATGNAELGFVALSQVIGTPESAQIAGSIWRVPDSLHREIRQDAVLLTAGERSAAARALLVYLAGPAAGEIVRAYGYAR